ncbi:NAD(P)H-binding protein [Actinomycetospora rhizophila]|uniref:NAD(P)H-binding protein n=1 Tax=Actinomycetospora rhizophila TaxID=1416876 RepID=A0ABV9ZCX8_9PSEU
MSNDDLVLVLGATGKTGRRVAARLRLRGARVRAASRSSATRFDWSEPDGWDAALAGVTAVYLVAPYEPGPVPAFVARAQAAGVRRMVLLSGRGADSWGDSGFGQDMLSAEAAVRGSSLEWTVLRPCNFAQNFDEELLHAPVLAGDVALPAGTLVEPLIDIEDVADVAATVLLEPGRHAGRTHELTGPRALTYAEAVALIARATDRPITYRQVGPAAHTAALVGQGLDEESARTITAMYLLIGRGVLAEPTDGVAAVTGRAPRPFEDYVLRTAVTGAWTR